MGACNAVLACQSAIAFDRFMDQFKSEILAHLCEWCKAHKDLVRACYVPMPFGAPCIKVFIVGRSERFDFGLSDLIADLEQDRSATSWPCDILQIPSGSPEELRTFFDPGRSILVYEDGDCGTAPSEV
jgi:hypothetical protein